MNNRIYNPVSECENLNYRKEIGGFIFNIDVPPLWQASACACSGRLITFANGNTIEYIYDATGVKLEKIVKESGQTDKITDYVGGVVYEDNVRKFMSTEEGRIMLESTPEYQYHMKDHLGNVRLTFTTASSAQQTSTYLATMETEVTTLEAATFNNIEATQTEDKIYNHTPGGKASARLNAVEDRVMGPSMTLQVMPGDTIRMKVQAKYFKKAKSKDPIAGMASIVAASMGAGTISEAPQIAQGIQETLGLGQAGLVSKDNTIPKAYINYLFFDKENTFKKGGYMQVSEAALGSFEELDLEYIPEEEGTMMIYTANQTAEDLDVYMDDLTILHTEGPIIRVDDYYPFGMTYHTSERTGYTTNNFLYNGKELQTDLDLDWYDYGARMYDASLGRFFTQDRFAGDFTDWSPYHYANNNPIVNIDINGDSTLVTTNEDGTYSVYGGNPEGDNGIYVVDKDGNLTGEKIGESMTSHSFFDDDDNPVVGAMIDLNSTEGKDFINKLIEDNPTLFEYMDKAGHGEFNAETGERNIYNIKEQGINERGESTPLQYRYRGSVDDKGRIGSARDFGNYGAGLVAGRKGLGIVPTRIALDAYESSKKPFAIRIEPKVTRKAEHKGYWRGIKMHFGF